ncbi:unnamed protein product [Sphenostylis stenocarpa]|uniref:Uncharacterized protein n=1 Tax=Sphenostylis stenocarpa TaxID=92480 RepID=A0AA86SNS1_9FABA|nr:unnamed protein product [Sphenostylis stenocarpa]
MLRRRGFLVLTWRTNKTKKDKVPPTVPGGELCDPFQRMVCQRGSDSGVVPQSLNLVTNK